MQDGKISAPDAILNIQLASSWDEDGNSREPVSRREAGRELRSVANAYGGAALVGPRGESIDVGPSFILKAFPLDGPSICLGEDGITRDRFWGVAWERARPRYMIYASILLSMSAFCALFPWLWLIFSAEVQSVFKYLLGEGGGNNARNALFREIMDASVGPSIALWCIGTLIASVGFFFHIRFVIANDVRLPSNLCGLSLVVDKTLLMRHLSKRYPHAKLNYKAYDADDEAKTEIADEVADTAGADEKVGVDKEGAQGSTVAAEKRATGLILQRYRDGDEFTKDDMRELLTSPDYSDRIGMRGFDRAWSAARAQEPKLGKPGRKSRRRIDTDEQ